MINTRLDSKSESNDRIEIVQNGIVIATVIAQGGRVNLGIETAEDIHLEKLNGWTSQKAHPST